MIRIIKEGKIPLNEKKTTCEYCKTEFAYDFNEVIDIQKSERQQTCFGRVTCPICSNKCLSEKFSEMDYYLRFRKNGY